MYPQHRARSLVDISFEYGDAILHILLNKKWVEWLGNH